MKQGDLEGAARISQGTLGTSTGVGKNANNELSLIDFDGDTEPFASSSTQHTNLEDDLLGLSFQDQSYGQGGGIVLGFGANTSTMTHTTLSFETNCCIRCARSITAILYYATEFRQSAYPRINSSTPTDFHCSYCHEAQLRSVWKRILIIKNDSVPISYTFPSPAATTTATTSGKTTTIRSLWYSFRAICTNEGTITEPFRISSRPWLKHRNGAGNRPPQWGFRRRRMEFQFRPTGRKCTNRKPHYAP